LGLRSRRKIPNPLIDPGFKSNRLFSTVIIMVNMENKPDWIFYQHDGPVEADVMPRTIHQSFFPHTHP
jgi:hypothetical protein